MHISKNFSVSLITGVIVDVFIFGLLVVLLNIVKHVEPREVGFLCGDTSLRYPVVSGFLMISATQLLGIILPIAFIIILVTEVTLFICKRKKTSAEDKLPVTWTYLLTNLYRYLGTAAYIAVVLLNVTAIIKKSTGRLRPDFVAVCKPNFTTYPCLNETSYIPPEACTGNEDAIQGSRTSFISGHSVLTVAFSIYLSLYLQWRVKNAWRSFTLVPFFQLAFFSVSVYIMTTRLSAFSHHLEDIVAGALVSVITVPIIARNVGGIFGDASGSSGAPSQEEAPILMSPIQYESIGAQL